MVLYLIGIGLGNEKDITLNGLEAVKKCDKVYLESYTSKLNCEIGDLERLYGKKVIIADRNLAENKADEIVKEAKTKDVAFLVTGDVFSATTHQNFSLQVKNFGVETKVIHNTSILTAIGETGLDLYKFGRTVSIPMNNKDIISPVRFLKANMKLGLHTLILLDMVPLENKFLSNNEACNYLIRNSVPKDTLAVGCAAIGCEDAVIKAGSLKELSNVSFTKFPQCLVIPGKLHFVEEEMIEIWKK